jgi:hypothetical protein
VKIDPDYLKVILSTFLDSPDSFVELRHFEKGEIEIDDKFLFHMQLLEDQSLVQALNRGEGLGYVIALGGNFEWMSKPLRLTAAGHEFAEALNRKEVWEKIKGGFKDASLATLISAAKELLTAFVKTQAKKHFEV